MNSIERGIHIVVISTVGILFGVIIFETVANQFDYHHCQHIVELVTAQTHDTNPTDQQAAFAACMKARYDNGVNWFRHE